MNPDREDIFFYSDSMLKPLNLVLPFSGITVFILQNSPHLSVAYITVRTIYLHLHNYCYTNNSFVIGE